MPVPHNNTETVIKNINRKRFDSMVVNTKHPTGMLMIIGARKTNKYTPPFLFANTIRRFFLLNFFKG